MVRTTNVKCLADGTARFLFDLLLDLSDSLSLWFLLLGAFVTLLTLRLDFVL
jgi:hypothetical protein